MSADRYLRAMKRFERSVASEDMCVNFFLIGDGLGGATSLGDDASPRLQQIASGVEAHVRGGGLCPPLFGRPVDVPTVQGLKKLIADLGGMIAAVVVVHYPDLTAEVVLAIPPAATEDTRRLAHAVHASVPLAVN